jgi:hypothetical protein
MSRAQVVRFLKAAGLTPKLVKTTFQTAGLEWAIKHVSDLRKQYNRLPARLTNRIEVTGIPKTKADLREVTKGINLTKGEKKILLDLQSASAKTGIQNVNTLLNKMDAAATKKREAKVDTSQATTAIHTLQSLWNNWVPPTKTVHVKNSGAPGAGANENGGLYSGGVRAFADGGYGADGRYYSRVSQIVNGGANILWGEQSTGWEAYISGKPSQRGRNRQIWAEAGRRLGAGYDGRPRSESAARSGTVTVRHVVDVRVTGEMDMRKSHAQLHAVATSVAEDAIAEHSQFMQRQG